MASVKVAYGILKSKGVDTKDIKPEEVWDKVNELQNKDGGVGTPAENKKLESMGISAKEDVPKASKEIKESKYKTGETENYKPSEFIRKVKEYQPKSEAEQKNINKYLEDLKNEPKISQDMRNITEKIGSDLLGYDFRVKSANSFLRKLGNEDKTIKDNVRYTINTKDNTLKTYIKAVEELQKLGYKEIIRKNYWLKNGAYKGINTNFKSPDGTIFEVQYHSPEGVEKKEQIHKLYEIQRQLEFNSPDWNKYEDEMRSITKDLKTPDGIEKIDDFNEEDANGTKV